MSFGLIIAIAGAALAVILPSIGSAYGVRIGGEASAGVVSENPDLSGKLLVLQILPGTQGFYGFVTAFIVMIQLNMIGGEPVPNISTEVGWQIFGACMPMAVIGLISAVYQAKTAVSAIHMVAKQPDASGKGITMVALVETYAILALLVSLLLLLFGIPIA